MMPVHDDDYDSRCWKCEFMLMIIATDTESVSSG